MKFFIDEKFYRRFQQMDRWIRNFRLSGDGVSGRNSQDEGASYHIAAPPAPPAQQRPVPVLVKIVGTGSAGGWYSGNIWLPPTTAPDPTVNLTEAMVGTAGSACYVMNTREVGKTTHDIDVSGTFLPMIFVGIPRGPANDGTPIYAIDGQQWENCA